MPTIKKSTQSVKSQPTTPTAPPAAATPAASPPEPAPVDPNAALEQYAQQTVTQLDTVEVGLGADPALTPAQKRHALKFRKGGDKIIAQIGNLRSNSRSSLPRST